MFLLMYKCVCMQHRWMHMNMHSDTATATATAAVAAGGVAANRILCC